MDHKKVLAKAEEYIRLEKNRNFRDEVVNLIEKKDWDDLSDRFYTDLSFGTGGLRGVIGGGFNRMNPFVVTRATQGLANYVQKTEVAGKPSAVIAYDSRRFSGVFAEEAALVFCGNGIKTYLFSALRPTPELSFAVRRLNATTGIVVTASHNPPEYNGYKVYWSDGGQIVPPHDTGIIGEVRKVATDIRRMDKKEALDSGMLVYIDDEIDAPYQEMIASHVLRPDIVKSYSKKVKVVYTPLHGTGAFHVEKALSRMGIEVITVPEQREPDGEFPTVGSPNPEESSAMEMALELGRREKADLIMGTDPDSDRIGIAVPKDGDFILLSGNQLGALLADYIFSALREQGKMPENPAFIKTIVTTELQALIARDFGAEVYDVLTGFKYIAEKIRQFEEKGVQYIFGGEESYGFLVGTEVRDKDAVSAAAMTAEMTLYDISRGITVLDHLNDLYRRYGYFKEILISKKYAGESGKQIIQDLMKSLRENPPEAIAGIPVKEIRDYLSGTFRIVSGEGGEGGIDLPSSNVLQFILEDSAVISARPSGTEPKIKIYASARSEESSGTDQKLEKIREFISTLLD